MTETKSIAEVEEQIVEEFELFDDWMDKYEHLIEMGKSLPFIEQKFKTDEFIVKGCQSLVWLHPDFENGILHFTADSDAIITKGMIAILLRVLNDRTPDEIINAKLEFIDKINLKEHLTPTRANGLVSMLNKIKAYAEQVKLTRSHKS
ncbi:MAG TPA: Fe-S metabolism protein SufE [Bacteroidetes bacterium]|nr:Fe-S metabolism protein SufE [Bacteroidota bacterium]